LKDKNILAFSAAWDMMMSKADINSNYQDEGRTYNRIIT